MVRAAVCQAAVTHPGVRGIIRDIVARCAPLHNGSRHYPLPYLRDAAGSTGLGKSLKSMLHPVRNNIPIWIGAEGPQNVALTGEIADEWHAIFYTPRLAGDYEQWLADGLSRPGARRTGDTFEVAASVQMAVTDDVAATVESYRPSTARLIGGMGAPDMHFHADVYRRIRYAEVVGEIGAKFRAGDRDGAMAGVPDGLILEP